MNKLDRVEQHSIGDGHNHGPQPKANDNKKANTTTVREPKGAEQYLIQKPPVTSKNKAALLLMGFYRWF